MCRLAGGGARRSSSWFLQQMDPMKPWLCLWLCLWLCRRCAWFLDPSSFLNALESGEGHPADQASVVRASSYHT